MVRTITLLVGATLLAAGCSAAQPTPLIVYHAPPPAPVAPPPSAAPTLHLTPTVPGTTPTPIAQASAREDVGRDFAYFLDHLTAAVGIHYSSMNAVADSWVARGDLDDAIPAANAYQEWSAAELAWLDVNPPRPCYADLHAEWRAVIVAYQSSMDSVLRSDEEGFLSGWDSAGQRFDRLNELLEADHCSQP